MSSDKIILYDLTSKPKNVCITPNMWKGRAVLNYKNMDYETVWLEYPDVEPTLKPHVQSPYGGTYLLEYTVPTIVLPDGTYVMESLAIAKAVETLYPTPRLVIDEEAINEAQNTVDKCMFGLVGLFVHSVTESTITDKSYEYFVRTRTAWFKGTPLADVQAAADRDKCLADVQPALQALIELVNRNGDGPFVHGREVGFADFVIVALWKMLGNGAPDVRDEIFATKPSLQRHNDACKPWLERDDY